MDKVIIFDTTLRDGEQSPGASLSVNEKLEVALQLARLNVDVIEAGFPASSPTQFEAVQAISREVKGPVIAGLARALKVDIDRCWEALKDSPRSRIHTFIATSEVHMRHKLHKSEDEVLQMAVEAVKLAKRYCPDVEFSPEDSSRTDKEFLFRVVEAVIDAGATVVNIPDTVGYATPGQFGALIQQIREKVPNIDRAILSVHCHNDLGMAVASSLAAVEHGAQQVECTINGIGERAGNASLEEVAMALKVRKDYFGKDTNIKTEEIYKTSRLVSILTGISVQPNKAIVGANAFAHEAGIHQDGVLKERKTYEIMTPRSIGLPTSRIVLGRHSGRHGFKKRLAGLGYRLTEEELNRAYERFLRVADKKEEIFDEDLAAIVEDEVTAVPEVFHLEYLHVSSGNQTIPTATIRLRVEDGVVQEAACGDGPVDAAYKAMDKIIKIPIRLEGYSLRAVTSGKDAMGEVMVRIVDDEHTTVGRGASTDVIEASVRAYINAINKLIAARKREA